MTQKETDTAEEVQRELQKQRAQLDAKCTEDELEQEGAWS